MVCSKSEMKGLPHMAKKRTCNSSTRKTIEKPIRSYCICLFLGTTLGAQVAPQQSLILRRGDRTGITWNMKNKLKTLLSSRHALSEVLCNTVGAVKPTGGVRGTLDALHGDIPDLLIERRRKSPTWCKTVEMNATCRLASQSTACNLRGII